MSKFGGHDSMVECNLPKVDMGVRFSLPAPEFSYLLEIDK